AQQRFEFVSIRKTIRAVRKNNRAFTILVKQLIERLNCRSTITKESKALLEFLNLFVLHHFETAPVAGEAFEKVVTLDIAVVIRPRDVGRIKINKVDIARPQGEHIGTLCSVPAPVVEHDMIESFDLLQEVLFYGEAKVAPAIVITIASKRENAARLFLETRPNERCAC